MAVSEREGSYGSAPSYENSHILLPCHWCESHLSPGAVEKRCGCGNNKTLCQIVFCQQSEDQGKTDDVFL